MNDEVLAGRDGMLFHLWDGALDQLCRGAPFDPRGWVGLLSDRAARHAAFTTLIVPERHVVHAGDLPAGLAIDPERPVAKVLRGLAGRAEAGTLYPLEELQAAGCRQRMFCRTDQHVTDAGAYVCYRALLASPGFRFEPITEDRLVRQHSRLIGDLGVRLDDEPDEAVTYLRPPQEIAARKTASLKLAGRRVTIYERGDAALPRAVWFGDSHGLSILPFLATHFSRVVAVQSLALFTDLIAQEQPDHVISQFSELRLGWPKEEGEKGPPEMPIDVAVGADGFYGALGLRPEVREVLHIDFGASGNSDAYCRDGWSEAEDSQRWSVGLCSRLEVPAPPRFGTTLTLAIDAEPFLLPLLFRSQRLEVLVNGILLHACVVEGPDVVSVTIPTGGPIAEAIWGAVAGRWSIQFRHPDARSPSESGLADDRVLGLAFRALTVRG